MSHYKSYPACKDSGGEWLGKVPEHWSVSPLWPIVTVNDDERSAFEDESEEIEYVDISTVTLEAGISSPTVMLAKDAPSRAQRKAIAGDVVISTVRTYLRAIGKVLPHHESAIFSTGFAIVRAGQSVHPGFLYYALLSEAFLSEVEANSTGVSYPAINASDIVKIKCPLPCEGEQKAIASHLDRETARIDALVEKKTRFIELLREKRQALITHAVTKGLDPNAKMKYSGVEWLGEVPSHWDVKQLKHVVDPNSSITYGIVQAGPEFEGGVPYIRTSDMSGDVLPIAGYPLTSPEIDESYARSRVRPGDIVMSIRASVGKCLPVPDGLSVANLTQGTAKVSPGKCITRNFLLAFLNSGAAQVYFDLMAKGATFKEITLDALRRTPVLLPPLDEQADIDQFVAQHIGRLDQLRLLSEQSIAMLKERRSALITAAVTGQIDLREAV